MHPIVAFVLCRLWRAFASKTVTRRPFGAIGAVGVAGLAVAVLLAGCGPTGGGTGTGESAFVPADFGARAASACSAPFAGSLSCATVSASPADVPALSGTASTVFAADTAAGSVSLSVRDNRADLQLRCQRQSFVGDWGVLPTGEGRFFGSLFSDGPEQAAQLQVQQATGAAGLQVLLLSATGQVVQGPWVLQRVSDLPGGAPVCP